MYKQAVEKLMQNAQSLEGLFAHNYQNEANRPTLLIGVGQEGFAIERNLNALMRTELKPALNTPNSAYNQFISTWNNGTGDLGRSFNRISDFWRLLSGARPELDRLMPPQPGPGPQPTRHHGTPAEVAVFTRLRSETNDLFEVFKSCVANHTPSAASRIKEHVRVTGELLNNSSLNQHAQTVLTNSKREWGQFTIQYRNGAVIDRSCLSQLGHFVNFANIACAQFLG